MNSVARKLVGTGLDLPPLEAGEAGDPGLFGPGSMVWRVARERVILAAGPAALLMQIAHPLVAAGVVDHSGFRRDPFQRLRATLGATLRITFGDHPQARDAGRAVAAVHGRVKGQLRTTVGRFPAGEPYLAGDPELALWVYATLIGTSIEAYERLVAPLCPEDRERHYQEAKPFGRLFGVGDDILPASHAEFRRYFERMIDGPDLAVGEDAAALTGGILRPTLPGLTGASLPLMRMMTASLLPARLRTEFRLSWSGSDRAMAAWATRSIRTGVRLVPAGLRYWPHYRVALRRMAGGNESGH
jgi:uncharacterized protein (DUF2236 family)